MHANSLGSSILSAGTPVSQQGACCVDGAAALPDSGATPRFWRSAPGLVEAGGVWDSGYEQSPDWHPLPSGALLSLPRHFLPFQRCPGADTDGTVPQSWGRTQPQDRVPFWCVYYIRCGRHSTPCSGLAKPPTFAGGRVRLAHLVSRRVARGLPAADKPLAAL